MSFSKDPFWNSIQERWKCQVNFQMVFSNRFFFFTSTMSPKEDNLSAIVSLIQVVKLLRGSSFTGGSYLFSTKLYFWEDQSLECPKIQLDYLGTGFKVYLDPPDKTRGNPEARQGHCKNFMEDKALQDSLSIFLLCKTCKNLYIN